MAEKATKTLYERFLAATMVFGTCGVLEIEFWRNTQPPYE
jgi:hypothetical protein